MLLDFFLLTSIFNMSYYFKTIWREMFYVFTGALFAFSLMEIVWPGIVLAYVNINWVLIIWLGASIMVLVMNDSKQ